MGRELLNASGRFGAAMGRKDCVTEPDFPVKFNLVKLRWVSGDYDQGGAYWGNSGGTDIFHAWGYGEEFEQELFIRALTRKEAKAAVLARFPRATFYR